MHKRILSGFTNIMKQNSISIIEETDYIQVTIVIT